MGLRQMKREHFGEHTMCQAQLLVPPHPLVNPHRSPEWLFSLSREGVRAQRCALCETVHVPISEVSRVRGVPTEAGVAMPGRSPELMSPLLPCLAAAWLM